MRVFFILPAYRGPVVLDFSACTVTPQVIDNFHDTSYLNNNSGKRSFDVSFEPVANSTVPLKKICKSLCQCELCSNYLKLMSFLAIMLHLHFQTMSIAPFERLIVSCC
jgi:hypothetical protein